MTKAELTELAVAEEREACARIADGFSEILNKQLRSTYSSTSAQSRIIARGMTAKDIAAAIRARSTRPAE